MHVHSIGVLDPSINMS